MANSPATLPSCRSFAVHGLCVHSVVAIKRKGGSMKFILSVAVALVFAVPESAVLAQYIDTNGHQVNSPSSSGAQTSFGTRDGSAHGGASATAAVPVPYPVLTSKFLRLQTDDAPYAVTTADFNGDGRMDIAAISFGFNAASIFIAEPARTAGAVYSTRSTLTCSVTFFQ